MRVFSVLILIAINAFFVTAEFAIVSVRRSRISQLVASGDAQARTVQSLQQSIDRLLSTTQIGITLSSLALGWIGEQTMAHWLREVLYQLPLPERTQTLLAHSVALPLAFFGLAYLQIVLGELCPKSLALLYPEHLARVLAPPSLAIAHIFNPFIWVLNQSTRWLLRSVGIRYHNTQPYHRVTSEELQLIITTERESIGLEADERELLKNVFAFGDVQVAEVMVPRTRIRGLDAQTTCQELVQAVVETGHSRYPVMRESLDDIVGIIDFKSLSLPLAQGQLTATTPIQPWVRPPRFIGETILLGDVLHLMQRSHQEMIMVVDEFGGTAGLVTLDDLIAEILGEEFQPDDPSTEIQVLNDQTFVVPAQLDLEEVNEKLDLAFPLTEEYQTLSGFLLYHLQRVPQAGEMLVYGNLRLTVTQVDGPRLEQVRIERQDLPPTVLADPEF
ncbi:MAG: HlyC/CorC family transporter [Spirulina sp. SIO3F2]|nr:HlyC/CorC family transporter [Spirulina sp. SIO3F2]